MADSPRSKALQRARRGSVRLPALSHHLDKLQVHAQRAKTAVASRKTKEVVSLRDGGGDYAWVPDDEMAFVPGLIVSKQDGEVQLEVGTDRKLVKIPESQLGPRITRVSALKIHLDDMVKMEDVNQPTILNNLRLRFAEDLIYTNIGTILVSVNPFKWFDHIFTRAYVDKFLNLQPGEIPQPHVFMIANAAYQGVRKEATNQAIIISGESGAGKTEATKKCLQFFAEAAGSSSKSTDASGPGIEQKLLAANPILEAFGNAKTVRNNNSSRFGKWMEVHFDGRFHICGSAIINYLLEKSRVIFQASEERNFHIFYQLCIGCQADPALREKYQLGPASMYHYINQSGCFDVRALFSNTVSTHPTRQRSRP